jgi:2'-5' RNA ligase
MQQPDLLAPAGDEAVHRLFFALSPDAALRQQIVDVSLQLEREQAPGGRRLNPDRYHLTLQFLGDFQPLRPSVVDAARQAADSIQLPAFELDLDHVGSFPGSNVWWLGTHGVAPGLQALWDALGAVLARTGVQVKSPQRFAPHLTIRRDVRRQIEPLAIGPLHWAVRDFVLFDSRPGQPYEVLHRRRLQDAQ